MSTTPPAPPRGDATREALIAAALEVFGRDGFHAASTRAIAGAAGVNQALIGYHFGGKQGLYLAVFDHIAAQMIDRQRPAIAAMEAALSDAGAAAGEDADARLRRYLPPLLGFVEGMAVMLTRREFTSSAQLILREQQAPTAAFSTIYDGFMGRSMGLVTRLLQRLLATDADVSLLALTILGQVLVFRAAHAAALRVTGWQEIGDTELAAIRDQVRRNVTAQLQYGEADR